MFRMFGVISAVEPFLYALYIFTCDEAQYGVRALVDASLYGGLVGIIDL